MKYGINFPNGGKHHDPRTLADLARLAEESGWDGVFIEDYIIWQGHDDVPTYDSWITLAAMAAATKRVRLGTMVTALPRLRPQKVAREVATLDHLSNGRMILGVGIGDTSVYVKDPSITCFGEEADPRRRAQMLDEALEIIAGLWSGKPFHFEGKFYHVNEVTFLPRPVQSPRVPIWIGGGYPRKGPLERAARWDGACLYKDPTAAKSDALTPEDVRSIKEVIAERRKADSAFDIAAGGDPHWSDAKKKREIRRVQEAGATWWIEYLAPQVGGLKEMRAYIKRGPILESGRA